LDIGGADVATSVEEDPGMGNEGREAIVALRTAHDDTARLVEGLREDQLDAQSGSAEWSVAQVLSHLGSASEIALATLRAGKGDPEGNPRVWARWDAMSPAEQAAGFVTSEGRLVEALEALSDDELASKRLDLGFLPMPVDVAFLVGMRLSEVALHRWDVDVALDPAARLLPYLVPFVLERLPMFAGYFAKPIGKTGAVAIETSDPSRSYLLELGDDRTSLSEVDAGAVGAGARVRMPAEAFVRLTAGRLSPAHTPGAATVEGAISLDDLRRLFPGI
jgi:uncharacterized protein (TIGR03083 family)